MALHIEENLDDLARYMQDRFGSALADVMAKRGTAIQLPAPQPQNYFIGEPSRYRAYNAPAVFLVAESTARPTPGGADEGQAFQKQEHTVMVALLIEEQDEERLSRACYRYAEAADSILEDVDISGANASDPRDWSTKCFITDIDYGVMFTAEQGGQRTFRKDVVLNLLIKHWDLLTPRA